MGVSCHMHSGGASGEIVLTRDPIIDEVRRIREEQAARQSFDLKKILAAAKKCQLRSKHKVVSFIPKKRVSA